MAPPTRPKPMSSCMLSMAEVPRASDLDVDDLLHPDEADDHHHHGPAQKDVAQGVVEQLGGVLRVDHEHGSTKTDGEQAEHDGAHAAFCGERGHVPAQA